MSFLREFGPVVDVNILHDRNVTVLVAFVEMEIAEEQVLRLTSRVSNFWYEGNMVNAWRVLLRHRE